MSVGGKCAGLWFRFDALNKVRAFIADEGTIGGEIETEQLSPS